MNVPRSSRRAYQQLLLRVHDDRPIPGDGLAKPLRAHEQDLDGLLAGLDGDGVAGAQLSGGLDGYGRAAHNRIACRQLHPDAGSLVPRLVSCYYA